MRRIVLLFALALLVLSLAACKSGSSTGNSGTQNPTVTMDATTFQNATITISKGETITFTDDATTGTPHILVIGKDGAPDDEDGAPDFGGTTGKSFQPGDSWTSPPWNTSGTYHVTCTIHPTTMTLTVIVNG
ncbi:MAG TPA: cupredoxin domain-containing protein [Ktedonobacterales bacterium]|nr:cupredoxin domain-containing protein [Ktedonobacterales bacterium]